MTSASLQSAGVAYYVALVPTAWLVLLSSSVIINFVVIFVKHLFIFLSSVPVLELFIKYGSYLFDKNIVMLKSLYEDVQ